jgi:hypothetical protein
MMYKRIRASHISHGAPSSVHVCTYMHTRPPIIPACLAPRRASGYTESPPSSNGICRPVPMGGDETSPNDETSRQSSHPIPTHCCDGKSKPHAHSFSPLGPEPDHSGRRGTPSRPIPTVARCSGRGKQADDVREGGEVFILAGNRTRRRKRGMERVRFPREISYNCPRINE